MANIKEELVAMLNEALKLEHAAYNQYLSHAQFISGLNAEKLIERLEEIAGDEKKHADKFRELIGSYLCGEVTMDLSETHRAKDIKQILDVNLKDEKAAVDFYLQIYRKVMDNKDKLPYVFERLEHEIRHIILDEEEHIAELQTLLG